MPDDSRPRQWPLALIAVLLGIITGLAVAETYVRRAKPRPPVQFVHGEGLHTINGAPVWEYTNDRRQGRECAKEHPERLRIMFLGSSITHGFDLPLDETFMPELERRLNADRPNPGFCVMNMAQVGYTSQQKEALASIEIPRYKPAVVLWESWNEYGRFVMVDDAAYELRFFALRPDGFPGIAGIPDGLNRFLFRHSRLYQYLTLSFGEKASNIDEDGEAQARLDRMWQTARSAGSRLGMYICPQLNEPFSTPPEHEPAARRNFMRVHADVPVYELRKELIDQDYLKLRIDDCCHFNATGHQALVPIFERMIFEILDGKPRPR